MRLFAFAVLMLGAVARADVIPDEPATAPSGACVGQREGASCGAGGRCVKRTVSRPDFSGGTPPKWIKTEVLVCVEPASAPRALVPMASLLLAALLAWLGLRGRQREPLAD